MQNREYDLLHKYLKSHDKYKVTSQQLETISKFEKTNNVSLQEIDRMKDIIEEYDLNKKGTIDFTEIKGKLQEKQEKEQYSISKTEQEIENEGIDMKKLGWHRKLHGYREYEKGQVEKELDNGLDK